ncbi:hypothetical protein SVIOM342S_09926 [Streptomyces violaceorubidus]
MAMLPVLAAYIIFQRQVVQGLTAGALESARTAPSNLTRMPLPDSGGGMRVQGGPLDTRMRFNLLTGGDPNGSA